MEVWIKVSSQAFEGGGLVRWVLGRLVDRFARGAGTHIYTNLNKAAAWVTHTLLPCHLIPDRLIPYPKGGIVT